MKCKYCSGVCKKKGWYTNIQKYQCKKCLRYQRESYVYQKISEHPSQQRLLNRDVALLATQSVHYI